jgi:hypothetical protein
MKVCSLCKKDLPNDFFYRDSKNVGGLKSKCKHCYQKAAPLRRYYKDPQSCLSACEFCGVMTSADGSVCGVCSREAVRLFGDYINCYDKDMIAVRNRETTRVQDSFKCVASVETRLRMKRIAKKMEENGLGPPQEAVQVCPSREAVA